MSEDLSNRKTYRSISATNLNLKADKLIEAFLPFLRMDAHATQMAVVAPPKSIEMTNLEHDAFQLLLKRIDFDLQVLRVQKARLVSHKNALYHEVLTHRKHAFDASCQAAAAFMKQNCYVSCTNQNDCVLRDLNKFEDMFCQAYAQINDAHAFLFVGDGHRPQLVRLVPAEGCFPASPSSDYGRAPQFQQSSHWLGNSPSVYLQEGATVHARVLCLEDALLHGFGC